jgi:hypothetical protein
MLEAMQARGGVNQPTSFARTKGRKRMFDKQVLGLPQVGDRWGRRREGISASAAHRKIHVSLVHVTILVDHRPSRKIQI